jgi:hypothetical protein
MWRPRASYINLLHLHFIYSDGVSSDGYGGHVLLAAQASDIIAGLLANTKFPSAEQQLINKRLLPMLRFPVPRTW